MAETSYQAEQHHERAKTSLEKKKNSQDGQYIAKDLNPEHKESVLST